jgi:hypothetical protein
VAVFNISAREVDGLRAVAGTLRTAPSAHGPVGARTACGASGCAQHLIAEKQNGRALASAAVG